MYFLQYKVIYIYTYMYVCMYVCMLCNVMQCNAMYVCMYVGMSHLDTYMHTDMQMKGE